MLKQKFFNEEEYKGYTESEAIQILKKELEKGIESMNEGPLYTIEEAWKEIDAI